MLAVLAFLSLLALTASQSSLPPPTTPAPTAAPVKCPPGTVTQNTSSQTNCYLFTNMAYNFSTAESYCQAHAGHLVTVNNVFDDMYITYQAHTSFPSATTFWIGGWTVNYSNTSMWLWTKCNGFLTYTNWKDPSAATPTVGSCVSVTVDTDYWSPVNCSQPLPFVCGIPPIPA